MANVMSLKKLNNHVHRNGFDLSRRNAFTAKVGELLPVFCEEVIPGDKFKINPEWFTRTRPLNTAAYTRVREYYDFYFVPFRLLWKGFDNFITQMENPVQAQSLTESSERSTVLPHVTMYSMLNYVQKLHDFTEAHPTNADSLNEVGLNRYYSTLKLLNYLNYGSFERIEDAFSKGNIENLALSLFPLLAYQKIYQDYYRDSQWEKAAPYTWNVDYVGNGSDSLVDITVLPEQWQDVMIFNQSYHSNLFDLRYCNWNKDLFFGLLPSPQFGDESFAPINIDSSLSASTSVAKTVNYDTTPNAVGGSDYNVNWVQSAGRSGYIKAAGEFIQHGHSATTTLSGNVSSNGLSILALRQAEALQKWKEISLSGSQDFRSQMKKHWGVDVGENRSDRCRYIGGSASNVQIGEVVNSNITSDYAADIAGKGIGNGKGSIDFESKDYGVILGIYHAVPLLDYESVGIKRFNTKTVPTDFAIPEFDSVGMQQVLNYQLVFGNSSHDITAKKVQNIFPLGYAPRYIEYKTAVDEIHGGFMSMPKDFINQQGFPAWVAPLNYSWLDKFCNNTDIIRGNGLSYVDFKVKPTILDSIFSGTIGSTSEEGVTTYDNTLSTDQLLCNVFFDCKAVRNLDYDGLPY